MSFESKESKSIFELVKKELLEKGFDLSKQIGVATDGAANMRGENTGVI